MTEQTVARVTIPLTKQRLHAKIMRGFSRAIDNLGKGAFLDAIDCTSEGLRKQMNGSMPSLETIDKALDAEATVLDDWLRAKGKRLVDKDAVCDVDDMGLLLSRVLVMLNEAEHPEGPGGRAIVPQEYLAGERLMRELHGASSRWLERCAEIRRPREVAA